MTPSSATGYAGTPLVRKLGYREGSAVFLAGAPGEYAGWPQTLPPGIVFLGKLGATADLVQVFEVETNVASHQEQQYGACRGGSMRRVTGIGGIFFKAKDAPALQAWYKRHLGIDVQEWGGTAFTWTDAEGKPASGTTIWSIGSAQGDHFAPGTATFMVNYRVEDLHALVSLLRAEGCNVLDKIDESEYGKFAWVIDPEGNKVELWQPPAGQ